MVVYSTFELICRKHAYHIWPQVIHKILLLLFKMFYFYFWVCVCVFELNLTLGSLWGWHRPSTCEYDMDSHGLRWPHTSDMLWKRKRKILCDFLLFTSLNISNVISIFHLCHLSITFSYLRLKWETIIGPVFNDSYITHWVIFRRKLSHFWLHFFVNLDKGRRA